MARPANSKKAAEVASAKSLAAQLWEAADKMRGAVPPSDYMHVSLGLVFLRYLSVAFEAKFTELTNTPHAARMTPRSTFRKASTERGVERW
jgi:type I restriction enzyme M protein